MTNPLKISILLATLLSFTACDVNKALVSTVKPIEIKELSYFPPQSYISLIKRGNEGRYNDSLSIISDSLFKKIAQHGFGKRMPLSGVFEISDTSVMAKIRRESEYLCMLIDYDRTLQNVKITRTLDSILEKRGQRFALISVATGFTRAKGNYAGQVAQGIGVGILTLGMYVQTPVKSGSTTYFLIVDSKDNNVAFFKKSIAQKEGEPLDEQTIFDHFRSSFEGYFWQSERKQQDENY
jgi:hypothetical protein